MVSANADKVVQELDLLFFPGARGYSVNADKVVKELDLLSILSSILGFLNDGNVQTRLQAEADSEAELGFEVTKSSIALTWLDLLVDMMFRPGEKASHRDLKLLVPLVSMVRDKDQQVLRKTLAVLAKVLRQTLAVIAKVSERSDSTALPHIIRRTIVLRKTLAVVAKVSERSDSTALPHIIRELLLVFASDATLMQERSGVMVKEERSGVMVKELCQRLDPEKVYLELAFQLEAKLALQLEANVL
ncbi:hypothetical protein T484DRAFT_1823321 [Baffinella frigidus]|nr:hypothetical protein T484DRAFT_1823321 [Cryptophyta sp. CCMP2293]